MNRKLLTILLVLAIPTILAIGYYTMFSVTFTVNNPITIGGELSQELEDVYAGDTIIGEEITVSNDAETLRELSITDDSGEDVEVTYKSDLTLTEKTVDFNSDVWEIPNDAEEVEIEYVLVGDSFEAEVTNNAKDGYVLIYYKDNSDRFNSPAKAILVEDIEGNLPYADDKNVDEYNYCETGEYVTCYGSKIWYVPSDAINEDDILDWSRANEFYYETKLIQYNSDGHIVLFGQDSLAITPEYTPNEYASGDYTIETTIA